MSDPVGVISIGDWSFPVDVKQMVRQPVASMRQLQDQGQQVGESSLADTALWRRKVDDFVLGQGQRMFDQSDENNRRRQRALSGFDPFTDRGALAVAQSMSAQIAAYAGGTSGVPKLLKTGSNWWAIPTGTGTIKRTTSLTNFATSNVTGTTAATDATVNGSTVYIADGSSVFSGSATGTSVSSFSTVDTDVLDACKGRLVCGKANLLFELDSTGVQIEIYTHFNAAFAWKDFCAGSVGIYCAGHDGVYSEILLSTLLDATGAIQPPASVLTLPAGELIRCMDFFLGFLIVGTNRGVRVCKATQSGLLDLGPIIQLGDVYGVSFEDRFAYVTCSALPTFGGPGVVKIDLNRFTSPFVPAYAAAFPITASGYTPYDVGVADGAVVCLLGNATNIQVQATSGSYGTGQMWSGLISFGVDEPKNVQSVDVAFDALTSGQSVTVAVYDKQGGTLLTSGTTSVVGETTLSLENFNEIISENIELLLTAVGQVTIRRWTVRAVPAPTRIPEEIILPLMFHREVKTDGGVTMSIDGYVAWQFLVDLMRTRSRVPLRFGNETVDVWVDQVGFQGTMEKWDERGRWPEGIVLVRLVTVL